MAKYFIKDGDGYVEASEALLTQPEVDNIVEKRLERQRNQFADYDTLKEQAGKVETIKSEFEQKLKDADTAKTELEKSLAKANLETEKVKIVHEFKLSDDLQEFVVGENADEMRKRAEKLAKGVTGGAVNIDKKPKPEDGKSTDSKVIAGKLFGNKSGE
jgi:chaperonin cofactor prefoldin